MFLNVEIEELGSILLLEVLFVGVGLKVNFVDLGFL